MDRLIDKIQSRAIVLFGYGKEKLCKVPSKKQLLFSIAVSAYIAFCPFVGFHTLLVIIASWLFSLNMPLLFVISCSINNPWTMVPIYAAGHWVGDLILGWCGVDGFSYNPAWVEWVNTKIFVLIGLRGISLWAFIIGGNILAILVAVSLYLLGRSVLKRSLLANKQV